MIKKFTAEEVPVVAPAPAPEVTPAPAAETETETEEESTATETPAAPEAKLGVFARAVAMLRDRSELLAMIGDRETTITSLTDNVTRLTAQVGELTVQLAGLKELEATVKSLESKQATVSAAARDQVAALGFPAKELPAQQSSEASESDGNFHEIITKLDAITDPTLRAMFYAKNKAAIVAGRIASAKN